ncbi:hypothetical protein [Aliikangiella maris]|uniref:Uncharacterized protein n=2 Tax=Aliikangiella maris TaxID=3162458 RepID=A0ABV3MUZ0_9GAMM
MKHLILIIILVLSFGLEAREKAEPKILKEYFSVLARETLINEGRGYVSNLGTPIFADFEHKNGNLFYVVASDIPKQGCFTIVFSYNKERMNFLEWLQRLHCKSAQESIKEYVAYDGTEFSFEGEQ